MPCKNATLTRLKAGPDDGLAEGQFTAYASVFGNTDMYGDVVQPGAFTRTLGEWAAKGSPIPLLFGHRTDDPDFNIGHVMTAEEDEHGLKVTAQLDLEAPKAVATYRLLKGRRINQMSFAYDVADGTPEDDGYHLNDLDLFEISVVPIGANTETEVLAVKAAATALAKAGRVLSTKNETALREARDAIDSVLSSLAEPDDGKAAPAADHAHEEANGTAPAKSEAPAGGKPDEPVLDPSVLLGAAAISRIDALI